MKNNDCLISFRRFIFINSGGEICPWLVASVSEWVFSVIGTTNNTPLTPLCRQGGRSLSAGYQNLDKQTVLQDQMPQHTKCFFAVWLNCSFNMSSVMWMIMLHWMTTFERTLALLCERFLLKWCLIPQFFVPEGCWYFPLFLLPTNPSRRPKLTLTQSAWLPSDFPSCL